MQNLFGEPVAWRGKRLQVLGCGVCPQNKIPGVNKVKGLSRIKRRAAMLWAQSPGQNENEKLLELVGKAGNLLWRVLKDYGLSRESFDIQNVMRCWPVDKHRREHKPTKEELQCCSVYNDEALHLNAEAAKVHLVLGEVAGKQLLGNAYRKSEPVFWHEPWNAYVVLNAHPSFILRSGGVSAGWTYASFVTRFRAVAATLEFPGKWGYVRSQNYGAVQTAEEFEEIEEAVHEAVVAGERVSVDIEDAHVRGRRRVLTLGIGWGNYSREGDWRSWKGGARSVVLWHPEADWSKKRLEPLLKKVRKFVADGKVKKVLQHGIYDKDGIRKMLCSSLRGYDFDTQYATYLYKSHLRSYSMENIIRNFLPEFQDYKSTLVAGASGDFGRIPLDRLVLYNCADCDVTKRAEALVAPHVSAELVQTYIHVARVLERMEDRGPWLDTEYTEVLEKELPRLIDPLESRLRHMAGDPEFNPAAPEQVAWLLYEKTRLPDIGDGSTHENVLKDLVRRTKHPAPQLVMDLRALYNVRNMSVAGYKRSAAANHGRLRTIWWLTGAATGRLRSGRGDSEKGGIVNLQNIHGNPLVQNLIVSDPNWRRALDA